MKLVGKIEGRLKRAKAKLKCQCKFQKNQVYSSHHDAKVGTYRQYLT